MLRKETASERRRVNRHELRVRVFEPIQYKENTMTKEATIRRVLRTMWLLIVMVIVAACAPREQVTSTSEADTTSGGGDSTTDGGSTAVDCNMSTEDRLAVARRWVEEEFQP